MFRINERPRTPPHSHETHLSSAYFSVGGCLFLLFCFMCLQMCTSWQQTFPCVALEFCKLKRVIWSTLYNESSMNWSKAEIPRTADILWVK